MVEPLNCSAPPYLPSVGPGRPGYRAVESVPRGVGECRPRSLVEAVGRDEGGINGGSRRARDRRIAAEVAGGVHRAHLIAERRRGGQGGVAEGGAGGLRDLGERRAARALAALDPVAGNGDVVARCRPAEIDPVRAGGRGQARRRGRRLRVRHRRRLRDDRRVRAEVPGSVDRAHLVAVRRARRQAGVAVAGADRLGDLGEVRAGRALAALDAVAGDADVVGRGRPAEVDPGRARRRRRQARRRRRRLRVRRPDVTGVFMSAWICGLAEGGVVDAEVVDPALEVEAAGASPDVGVDGAERTARPEPCRAGRRRRGRR